jgi:ribosomal protein S18 acetylase RimI-like enzyme
MEKDDLEKVVEIQKEIDNYYNLEQAKKFAKKKASICAVVECENELVGFVFYEIKGVSKIIINQLSVKSNQRRKGVGTFLIDSLISKLNNRRKKIEIQVSEYNLGAQLFLKKRDFKATEIFKDGNYSDYKFVYNLKEIL